MTLAQQIDRTLRTVRPGSDAGRLRWLLLSTAGAVVASLLTRGALTGGWRGVRGDWPPNEPTTSGGGWPRALAWGAATGLLAGVARVVGRRGAAAAWRRTAGGRPPA